MHNVLLITIDCLRADRLKVGGSRRQLSPRLDNLAEDAIVFSRCFASGPRTAESFPGILTSIFPMTINGSWDLPEGAATLAHVLKRAGYATAAFHSNPFLSTNLGYNRGFDVFWDSAERTPITSKLGANVMQRLKLESGLYRLLRRLVRRFEASAGMAHYAPAQVVTAKALDWLAGQTQPFMLWVHYMDMHYPYAPPAALLRHLRPEGISSRKQADLMVRSLERPETLNGTEMLTIQDLYDAGLMHVDQHVGRLLDAVQARHGLDRTAVIVTGDHGEEFLEHGQFGHANLAHFVDNGRARIRLYDELLHVPLVIHAPGQTPRSLDPLVSLVDVPPTVADLVGVAPAPEWQGVSLKRLIEGETPEPRAGVFSEYAVRDGEARLPIVAYRTARWKYIHDGAFGNHELYDLAADPGEHDNCYAAEHPAVQALQAAVQQHLAQARLPESPTAEQGIDALLAERLIKLGYLE